MRYLPTLGLLLWAVSASAFTVNGKTYSTWNGKTLATWNGVTAVAAVPTLVGFESGLVDSKGNTWTTASDPNGGYGSNAVLSVGSYGAGTARSGNSLKAIQGAFDEYGEGTTDITAGHLRVTASIGSGPVTLWVKSIGAPGHIYGAYDTVNGLDFAPVGSGSPADSTADTWTQMTSLTSVPSGTHSIDIGVYNTSLAVGDIVYVDDVALP